MFGREIKIMKKMAKSVLPIMFGAFIGGCVGATAVGKVMEKKVNSWQQLSDKHLALFQMMNQWVKVKQEGKNLSLYFEKNEYNTIAIYGMSYAGETLVDELRDTETKVLYGIDQRADKLYAEVDIVTLDETLEEVDAIVVTAITFFDEIEEKLSEIVDCPIISLEDVLYEV